MPKSPYIVFGINDFATLPELRTAYRNTVLKLLSDRDSGKVKADKATRKFEYYRDIYIECRLLINIRESHYSVSSNYAYIKFLIERYRLQDARELLDEVVNKTKAEWLYINAFWLYQKNWFNDSRDELSKAVRKEPLNTRYTTALKCLTQDEASVHPFIKPEYAHDGSQISYKRKNWLQRMVAEYDSDVLAGSAAEGCCDCGCLGLFGCCCEFFGGI